MAIIEPPGGDSNIGVRKEMPNSPYLRQILTKRRFFGVKTFFGFRYLLNIFSLTFSPKKVNNNTVVIIPETVIITVNRGDNPAA